MDELLLAKIITLFISVVLIFYSWQRIPKPRHRILFFSMVTAFLLSIILHFPDDLQITEWIRHTSFYIGEVLLYFFLRSLIQSEIEIEHATKHGIAASPQGHHVTIVSWFSFLTDQGLQHLITLPFLFLMYSLISMQFNFFSNKELKKTLMYFLFGGFVLVMIHIGEFIVESQHLFRLLEGTPIEISEFLWFYLGLLFFGLGMRRLGCQYKKI